MKLLLLVLLHAALIAGGWFAGTQLREHPAPTEEPSPHVPETSTATTETEPLPDDGLLRDPRTGATFVEAREQLENLAKSTNPRWGTNTHVEGKRPNRNQLDIHRVFAVATREDMLAYFAEEDLSQLEAPILSAAYGRLATLAPADAAAIWTEHFEREEQSTGVHELVHAWALQDPAAAEAWVDELPESSPVQGKALYALLDGALGSDLDLARRRFTELEDGMDARDIVTRIAHTLASEDFPAFAEQILAATHGDRQHPIQLSNALEVWARQDGGAMLAWIGQHPSAELRGHIIPRLTRALLKHGDPATIANELAPALDGNKAFAQLAGQAWMAWLASGEDDEAALAWLQANGKKAEFPQMWGWNSLNWSAERANQILPQLPAIPDEDTRTSLVRSIVGQLLQSHPKVVLEWAPELLPADNETANLLSNAALNQSHREPPETVLEWALDNLASGDAQQYSVSSIMSVWAESDPRAATDRIATLPEELRDMAYSRVSSRWAQNAPEQVFDYLKSTRDPSSLQSFTKYALDSIGYHRGSQAQLDQALALPDPEMRAEAVPALIDGWARANLEDSAAALNRLEKGPLRDASIEKFVSAAAQSDRESAVTWSLAIGNPGKRRQVTMRQARQWLNADRDQATRWIETAENLPAEWKEQLLEPKPQGDR